MAELSGKKFIARNRPPRVQIEYGVEIGHAEKMVQLPFVMGVMADLSGRPDEPLPRFRDRQFLEIDRENFNAVMKGMVSDHRGSNSQPIDFEGVEVYPIFMAKIENTEKSSA